MAPAGTPAIDASLLDFRLFSIAGTPITVATLIAFLVILVVTFVVSAVLQRALMQALRLRGIRDEGTVGVTRKLLHYLVMAIGVGIGLPTIGIDLGALFAAGAVFAIGLGFAMQNIAQNFVAGVILLLERAIKPGDVLSVEGRFVRVQRMGIRATVCRTLDEEEIIVPNSSIVQSAVINYTLRDSIYRLRCTVGVVYSADMALVRRTLEQTAARMSWRMADRDPVVLLTQFGDSSVNFEVSVWMNDPWRMRRALSELNEAIWWDFKEQGITIAFPQLDLHLDEPVVRSLESLARSA